eukprot:jgi/Galph1/3614/GphlegSOOS_G2270.1
MDTDDELERLLEDENLQKDVEDTQTTRQLLTQNTIVPENEDQESTNATQVDEELESLLEQQAEQKLSEDRRIKSTANDEEDLEMLLAEEREKLEKERQVDICRSESESQPEREVPASEESVSKRAKCSQLTSKNISFKASTFPVCPFVTHWENEWKYNRELPPLALQWTEEELYAFIQQAVRLGPSGLKQPWLFRKAVPTKNALECLLLWEALRHRKFRIEYRLHPNKYKLCPEKIPCESIPEYHIPVEWKEWVALYNNWVHSTWQKKTCNECPSDKPWSSYVWLRIAMRERRLIAILDWHIFLNFCNLLRPRFCPRILGADPKVIAELMKYACSYMRYLTRMALSLCLTRNHQHSHQVSMMNIQDVSKAIHLANQYYQYRGNYHYYSDNIYQPITEYPPSYDIVDEKKDLVLMLDRFYDIILVEYGWLDQRKVYFCLPKSLEVLPVTDVFFYEAWWHPCQNPSYKDLARHLLVRRMADSWISLWIQGHSEYPQEEEQVMKRLSITNNFSFQVPVDCRQQIWNAGCYYLAYMCRQLVTNIAANHRKKSSQATTNSSGVYFEYVHWHMLQIQMDEKQWNID